MLDIAFIRTECDQVKNAARAKGVDVDIDRLLDLDERRRKLITENSELRARRNDLSRAVRELRGGDRDQAIAESKSVGARVTEVERELAEVAAAFDELMLRVPSIPAPEVPPGESDADNLEIRRWSQPRQLDFPVRDHVDLAQALDLVDFSRPQAYAGSRSYALKGDGVLLEQAVLNFALNHVAAKGFVPVSPPVLVKEQALVGTGFFPLGYEDTYRLERDGLFLAGTSEVGLVSLHRDEILDEKRLPIRYVGISPCFRREAGAAGKDTKGLYRVHAFNKVEQVVLCRNDEAVSEQEHHGLLRNAEEIVQALGLPHRVALACAKETGLGQVRKHELETWMPSRNGYCETHSCSTLHEFQARRSKIRYRDQSGSLRFVHTLNNTAIASPRILIAILENYQNADGSVTIPGVLRPYLGGRSRLEPRGESGSR
ncbi:MAG: serine--tRNA ligase [Candidatus Schekmanbacteria bacterium]|nr:serine--tRNA ligase [Candidatus Schekmanbacteria bacterium]